MQNQTFQAATQVCQGGDKYRITIVDFPVVDGWFGTSAPRGKLLKSVLIVPCEKHCRLEDIGPDGKFTREVAEMTFIIPPPLLSSEWPPCRVP